MFCKPCGARTVGGCAMISCLMVLAVACVGVRGAKLFRVMIFLWHRRYGRFFPSYGNKKLVQKVRKTGIVSLKHVARFEQTVLNFPLCLRRTLFVSCGSVRVSCQLGSCWHHKLVCRRSGLTTHPRDIWSTFGFQRATTFRLCCDWVEIVDFGNRPTL